MTMTMTHEIRWDEAAGCVRLTLRGEFLPAEAAELVERMSALFEARPQRHLLVDHRESPGALSRETRAVLKQVAARVQTDRIAFFGMTNLNRVMAKIVVSFGGQAEKSRFCASEAEALAWLAGGAD